MRNWLSCIACIALTGVAIAENPAAPSPSFLAAYQAGHLDLVSELVIGGEDQDILLAGPTRLCVDAAGHIFVVDSRTPAIFEFDAEGQQLMSIDSVGEGPGDIARPSQIALQSDSSIVVYDPGNQRFNVFDRNGEFLSSTRYQPNVWRLQIADGAVYVETQEPDFRNTGRGTTIRVLRMSPEFTVEAVVDSAQIITNKYITEPTFTNVPQPFSHRLLWSSLPTGELIVARSDGYRLSKLSRRASEPLEITRQCTPVEVTSEDRELHFDGMVSSRDGVQQRGAPQYIRDATEFPSYKPCFRDLLVDHEGYILLETYDSTEDMDAFDVFSPDLQFIGTVQTLPLSSAAVFAHGRVYDIGVGEDGTRVVRRYRAELQKPSG